jgi:hypothetical protein
MNIKYKIELDCSFERIEFVFNILFNYGFVFTTGNRVRDFNTIKRDWLDYLKTGDDDYVPQWHWIVTGYDKDCQMVFGIASEHDSEINQFKMITIDEFINLHKKIDA